MRSVWLVIILVFSLMFIATDTFAADYTNSLFFKVTVVDSGKEIEFEYENPAHYEWEVGSKVIKGTKAKEKVEKLYQLLNVSTKPTVEKLKEGLEEYGFSSVDKFIVKWVDPDGNLFTWHWDKTNMSEESKVE